MSPHRQVVLKKEVENMSLPLWDRSEWWKFKEALECLVDRFHIQGMCHNHGRVGQGIHEILSLL